MEKLRLQLRYDHFAQGINKVFTVTYWATLLLIAFIMVGSFSTTRSPNALVSRNSLTFGANAANCDGNFTSCAIRRA